MTPVTPYLSRYAVALAAGTGAASLAAAVAPGAYWAVVEARLFDLPSGAPLTVARVVGEGLMAAFVLLLGKEAWEALTRERGGLAGRGALVPLAGVAGGMAAAALAWTLLARALETDPDTAAAPGWAVPFGADVVLAVAFGRLVFGPAHPALQVILLITVTESLLGLLLAGLAAPGAELRPAWLLLSAAAAFGGWLVLTRAAQSPHAREQDRTRAGRLAPWVGLAAVSWTGVALAGLPPALGALPILPAMPRAARSFGLFATAEDFLTDPLNRLSRHLHRPLVAVIAAFGFTSCAVAPDALAATSVIAALAAGLAKPAGIAAAMALAMRLTGRAPAGLSRRDLGLVALLCGMALTVPALTAPALLPGGAAVEAARLGLALTLLLGPAALLIARRGT